MNKIIALIQRFWGGIKEFPLNHKEFGSKVSFWMLLGKTYPPLKSNHFISAIYRYIEVEMVPYFPQWKKDFKENNSISLDFYPIWFCWFQGEDHLGLMGKICLHQLRKYAPKSSIVVVLDYTNISDYVDIPDYIWRKHKEGLISSAHFSDVLRFSLLSKYGGLWVDSTVFTTKQIDDEIVHANFFSCKLKKDTCIREPSQGLWTGFLIGGQSTMPLFYLIRQCLYKYWEKHNRVIDYVFFDYCIMCIYKHDNDMRNIIDSIPHNNSDIWRLWELINEEFTEQLYSELMGAQTFYKTSHHVIADKYVNSKLTIWGKMLNDIESNDN